ncbi:MAG: hypothetical protein K0S28_2361 [Paucimonas sp.]|jgi:hypothetical protein|nr:hypothetical protein [Burkholderiales bacterium]MDF3037087.1 hypothetical protein [Paucimonas sp.]
MQTVEDRLNNALDAALEMTFPASDPIAVYIVESERSQRCAASHARNRPADTSENTSTFCARVDPGVYCLASLTSRHSAQ